MGSKQIQFWYEFASTYSYVSAMRIDRIAAAAGVETEWKPFLLGPIFAAQGWKDSPFNLFPAKGRYMWRDVARLCERDGIELKQPSQFPRNSLLAARVACIADPEWVPEFSRAVFRANFAEDRDISEWETLAEILRSIGRDAEACYELALSAQNKDRLKKQTEKARDFGIFGAPSFVADGELFWGNDRLDDAVAWALRSAD